MKRADEKRADENRAVRRSGGRAVRRTGSVRGVAHRVIKFPEQLARSLSHLLSPSEFFGTEVAQLVSEAQQVGQLRQGTPRKIQESTELSCASPRRSLDDVGSCRHSRASYLGGEAVAFILGPPTGQFVDKQHETMAVLPGDQILEAHCLPWRLALNRATTHVWSARPPVRPSARPPVRPSARPPVRPSARPPVRPSARPPVRPPCNSTNAIHLPHPLTTLPTLLTY